MKLKAVILSAFTAAVITSASAQDGSTTYSFLDIPASTQAMALGGANISVIDADMMLTTQNPALLGSETGACIGLSYMHYMAAGNFAGFRYGMPAGERGAWAAGMRYLNYGTITATDADGNQMGTFSPQDLLFDATYSHDFNDMLRGGITLKMMYSHYESYEAFAMGADVGLDYYDNEKDLSLALVLRNMGGQIKRFHDSYDRLPFDIQLGMTKGLGSGPFSLSITAWHLNKWKLPYYVHSNENGIETTELKSGFMSNLFRHLIFGLKFAPSENFYLAGAYNYKTHTDMATYKRNFMSGISLGLGFNVRSFSFGAAFAMPHKSATQIMLNLSMDISELIPQ